MMISEKQIMQLIAIAQDYSEKIQLLIDMDMAAGDPMILRDNINNFLATIRDQQSDQLKVIE